MANELVVVYDWQSVIKIWEAYFKGKIGMAERDQALAHGRAKLQDEMTKSSQKFGRIHND
jgi:hypothetical protein